MQPILFADTLVLVRGAGDLATGVLYRLHQAGFPVIATETQHPMAVRRTVAFSDAVYNGSQTVEGVTAVLAADLTAALVVAQGGGVPVLADPRDEVIALVQPAVLVDARLLKRANAAALAQAPLVIGLGPGFEAGRNCHAAIETKRGHRLGRVLWEGATEPDTGVPGIVGGYGYERLLRAPAAGVFKPQVTIGDMVRQGQIVGVVVGGEGEAVVAAPIAGMVRGLLHPGLIVAERTKLGDVDPRADMTAIDTISDKSLAIGGAVLAAVLTWLNANPVARQDKRN